MLRNPLAVSAIALALAGAATARAQQQAPPPTAPDALNSTHSGPPSKHKASKKDRDQAQNLFLEGAKNLQHDRPQTAMDWFARAAALDPAQKKYALSEQIARQDLVSDLVQQAEKARILGHLAEAHDDIAKAWRIDPSDPVVAQHVDELAAAPALGSADIRPAAMAPPIELKPKAARLSFHLRTSQRDLITRVLAAYGIQATLDDSVGAQSVPFNVDDVDFVSAEQALALATNTFLVPLDPMRALVARNTRENHDKYERQALETVYLPGVQQEQLTPLVQMAKDFFAAGKVTADAGAGTITVRAPASEMPALNQTLAGLMQDRSVVQLDVRMFEVDRTKAVDLGLMLPSQTTLFNVYSEARNLLNSNSSLVQEIISSGLAAPGDWEAILGILVASGQISSSIFSQPFGIFGGGLTMTGIAYQGGSMNMQLNSSDVRDLDQIQLRLSDRQEGTIKAGERYPIETSSYSNLGATSNLNIPGLTIPGLSSSLQGLGISASSLAAAEEETIPQVEYQDIGLSLDVTPTIEARDVSLKFHLTLSALAGSSLNSLPVLDNREYTAIISVPTGQTSILMSSISRQETDAITGIPGLSDIPGFQDATNNSTNLNIGELVVVITPHIVRAAHREDAEKMILLPREP